MRHLIKSHQNCISCLKIKKKSTIIPLKKANKQHKVTKKVTEFSGVYKI